MDKCITLTSNFSPFEVDVYIIDKFLFVEASKIEGERGVDYRKFYFKQVLKLPEGIDVASLKANLVCNTVRISACPYFIETQEIPIRFGK